MVMRFYSLAAKFLGEIQVKLNKFKNVSYNNDVIYYLLRDIYVYLCFAVCTFVLHYFGQGYFKNCCASVNQMRCILNKTFDELPPQRSLLDFRNKITYFALVTSFRMSCTDEPIKILSSMKLSSNHPAERKIDPISNFQRCWLVNGIDET